MHQLVGLARPHAHIIGISETTNLLSGNGKQTLAPINPERATMLHQCPQLRSLRAEETYVDGRWILQLHDVGWLSAGLFTGVASAIAAWLMWMHATYYHKPWEQRHIARILLMLPVYSIVSLLSYIFYPWAMAYNTISSAYEAFALCSFFLLLRTYLDPDVRGLKHDLRLRTITYWAWPLSYGFVKRWLHLDRMNGLTWYNYMTFGISQYAILRPTLAVLSIVLEQYHLFCEITLSPRFGNFYVFIMQSISVAVAMYCVVAFYLELKDEPALKRNRPLLKLTCIKLVIFLIFWQSVVLQLLAVMNVIKDQNEYWSARDVQTGLNALATCIEMAVFAVLHIRAFTYLDYVPVSQTKTTHRWRLVVDAFNFFDFVREFAKACRWLFSERKIFDPDRFDVETDDRIYRELRVRRLRQTRSESLLDDNHALASNEALWTASCSLPSASSLVAQSVPDELVSSSIDARGCLTVPAGLSLSGTILRPPPKLKVLQTHSRYPTGSKTRSGDDVLLQTTHARYHESHLPQSSSTYSLQSQLQDPRIPKADRVLGTHLTL